MSARSFRLLALFLISAIALGGLAAPAAAQTPVTLKGKVGNGTPGAPVPRDLKVTALQIGANGEEAARKETGLAEDKTFVLSGFDLNQGTRFAVTAEYLSVSYSRVIEQPAEGGGDVMADLVIYETTTDESTISISSDVLTVVGGGSDPFEVIQLQRVKNSSDRTFVGQEKEGTRQVLRLPVPTGAFDLLPLEGISVDQLATVGGGIVTGLPVIPGERSASYVYKVRAPGGWSLSRRVFYPTKQADLLVSPNLQLRSDAFKFEEEVKLQSRSYKRFRGGPFEAGSSITGEIGTPSGLPGPELAWGLAGGLALIALLGAGAFVVRRRTRVATAEAPTSDPRQALVDRIATLDDEFEKGGMAEEEYADRRRHLKELLASVSSDEPSSPSTE
jgi:hypothetical protein